MKKILIMALVFVMFIFPLTNTFAYDGGLLNGKTLKMSNHPVTGTPVDAIKATDGDLTTFETLSVINGGTDSLYYRFDELVDLTHYQVKKGTGSFNIRLYDNAGVMVYNAGATSVDTKTAFTISQTANIRTVAIENTHPTDVGQIYELDFFGSQVDPKLSTGYFDTHKLSSTMYGPTFDNRFDTAWDLTNNTGTLREFVFTTPVDINRYHFIVSSALNFKPTMTFKDGTGAVIATHVLTPTSTSVQMPMPLVSNVKSVVMTNTSGANIMIRDMDFSFQSSSPLPVTNLSETHTYDSVSLSWVNPSSSMFDGIKIKQNGVEVATLANTANSYNINGLSPNTSYTFEVTPTYSDGSIAVSESVTFTTLDVPDDLTPPSNITNINVAHSDELASFMYSLPIDSDFSHLKIYRDGVLKEGFWTATSYDDFALVSNTTYVYKFISVDLSGNESNGFVQSVTTDITVDTIAPNAPTGVEVTNGGSSGSVKWEISSQSDVKGYNVYVDGVKHNTVLVMANSYTIPNLVNDQNYLITVTAVDTSDNESVPSSAETLTPTSQAMPIFEAKYDLKDVADGTSSWFNSMWLILAFSVGIPLAFMVARKVKGLLIA